MRGLETTLHEEGGRSEKYLAGGKNRGEQVGSSSTWRLGLWKKHLSSSD